MKKILKNRFFYAVVAILLAFILCFFIAPSKYKDMDATVNVIKVKDFVPEGTILTEDMLKSEQVGSFGLNNNAVKDISQVVGRATLADLDPRNPIYKNDLVPADSYGKGGGLESLIGPGQSLVSVSMSSAASSVAGLAKPGDLVDVCYAHNERDGSGNETTKVIHPPLLKNMVVYSVMNSNLTSTASTLDSEGNTDPVPAVITFIATAEQEEELIRLEHSDSDEIHLVLLKEGAE